MTRLALKESPCLSTRMSVWVRILTAWLLALGVGCGKQAASSAPPAEPMANPTAPTAESASAVPRVESSAAADEAQTAAVLNELTQAVRKYSVEQRRVPKTLEEVLAKGYLSRVPPAPAGKRFAIDKNLQVDLVNR